MAHAMGWIPDLPDKRDLKVSAIRGELKTKAKRTHGVTIPHRVMLDAIMSPVRDQDTIGSCAGQGGVGLAESIGIEHLRDPFIPLSPLFLYYAARVLAGDAGVDSGVTLRNMMKALAKTGTCPEELWPYDVERFAQRPPKDAYGDTRRFRLHKYYRVEGLDEIKLAIAAKNPVVAGFQLYESFESDEVAKTGIVPLPDVDDERYIGGHAMLICGYDDDGGWKKRGAVKVKNSWGHDWGQGGYCMIPYEYFAQDLVGDCWTATV